MRKFLAVLLVLVVVGCGSPADEGSPDAGGNPGTEDSGTLDSGTPDSGTPDSGTPDSGTPDSGIPDAGGLLATLSIVKTGAGGGQVDSSNPAGAISCGTDCEEEVSPGTGITLTATAEPGSRFTGWSGPCSGTSTCTVTVSDPTTVHANFELESFSLTLAQSGSGSGTVTSTSHPSELSCGTDCSGQFLYGTEVTLAATPSSNSTFAGWSGACSGTGACVVTLSADTSVTARFEVLQVTAAVTLTGNGTGTVVSAPPGAIDCGTDCEEVVPLGSELVLNATPSANSTFTGWSGGGCSGTTTCSASIDGDVVITASFTLRSRTLTVGRSGAGTGTVRSSGTGGIDCGSDCVESHLDGTVVTLTAAPDAGSTFLGWSGACSGTGSCVVDMTEDRSVNADFGREPVVLTVARDGTGTGTVTTSPVGVSCGAECAHAFAYGTVVTLTATPAAGTTFTGWTSGGCSGTSTCTVTMTADLVVTAGFDVNRYPLAVTLAGTGSGKVLSEPGGIDCGGDCAESYAHGTNVTLSAEAATGSLLTGWSGACTGTGSCTVTMTAARNVTATFGPKPPTLSVTKAGAGTGTVLSNPAGITCGADCSESWPAGTSVTLTTVNGTNSLFSGWSGACTGTGACVVVLAADTVVTATFVPATFRLDVVRSGAGTGTVTSSPGGINCGADCNQVYANGATVTLTASASAGSAFDGWSGGGCSGTDSCVVTMGDATTVTAAFSKQSHALTIVKAGDGGGTVEATDPAGGLSCGSDCSEVYPYGTDVTLVATPDADSTFTGWSGGGCGGSGVCVVDVTAATEVTAAFVIKSHWLTVQMNGSGSIGSSPAAIDCGFDCSELVRHGSSFSLTATPAAGHLFTGWSGGGCSGTGTCEVTITGPINVVANFFPAATLTVGRIGAGSGTVVSTAPPGKGIDCGADCTEVVLWGSQVTLAATAAPGSLFTGWNAPGCATTAPCVVTVSGDTTVNATFVPLRRLTVEVDGTGAGTVTSNPAGIDCGEDCAEDYAHGTVVSLSATPGANRVFSGWSGGGCSGTGACNVTLNAATTVTATFDLPHVLSVSLSELGAASGRVQSLAPGIDCGADCTQRYDTGVNVVLTATPAAGYVFGGWTGECSGFGGCVVSMTASKSVEAIFAEQPNYVFVTSTTRSAAMGGLAGADAVCNSAASASGLGGTYRAWLSTPTISAISRLGQASGWVRPDGKPVFNSQADLTSGRVQYLPTMTELGTELASSAVRTGTGSNGTFSGSSACTDWTVSSTETHTVGNTRISDGQFTSWNTMQCTALLPIYCFGIDRQGAAYVPPGGTDRIAFLSSARFGPASSGLAGADAICAAAAASANLTGTFRALLATTTASAASRFDTSGTPWARPDGVRLASTAAGMFTGNWQTGLNRFASGGVHVANQSVWSGAATMTSVGSAASTCADWSPSGTTGSAGITGQSLVASAFGSSSQSCASNPAPLLYCLQE